MGGGAWSWKLIELERDRRALDTREPVFSEEVLKGVEKLRMLVPRAGSLASGPPPSLCLDDES